MKTFEYMVMNASGHSGRFYPGTEDGHRNLTWLSIAGKDGWELVSVTVVGDERNMFFKRELGQLAR